MFSEIDQIINGVLPVDVSRPQSNNLELEQAPNHIQFIESPRFLNSLPLFPEQYNIIRNFFELLCPECNDIEKLLNSNEVPRGKQILFEYNRCPRCGKHKSEFIGELSFYTELIGVAGMRSGKTTLAACAAAAHIHNILYTVDLQEKLGIQPTQVLDISFSAAGKKQSSSTTYGQFKNMYDRSPWFQSYKKHLMDKEDNLPDLRRHDLYKDTDTSMFFKANNIRISSVSSNSATQAGQTRIMVILDELARLDSGDSKRSATEVYRVMDHSLLTVRSAVSELRKENIVDVPDGIIMSISSPLFKHDKSMKLLDESRDSKKMYSFHMSTYEMNPNIKKETLKDKYKRDPIGAKRDYDAVPPGAENVFVEDPDVVEACIDRSRDSIFKLREVLFTRHSKNKTISFDFVKIDVLNMKLNRMVEYAVHCDAGESSDSFCMAIGHIEDDICVIDGAIAVEPIAGEKTRKVHFPSVIDTLLKIERECTIRYVTYDRWNSTDQIHRIIDRGVPAFGKNIDRESHMDFLEDLIDGNISLPNPEIKDLDPTEYRNVPCSRAIFELLTLNDDGIKVDHQEGQHNDMIQCYIGVHRLLKYPEKVVPKNLRKLNAMEKRRRMLGGGRSMGVTKKLRR